MMIAAYDASTEKWSNVYHPLLPISSRSLTPERIAKHKPIKTAVMNGLIGRGGNRNGNRTRAMKEAIKFTDRSAGLKYIITAATTKTRLSQKLP
jgi:hypothetical protein